LARFIGRDCGAFYADMIFFNGFGGINGDLIVSGVTILDA